MSSDKIYESLADLPDSRLVTKDLLPTTKHQRNMTRWTYFLIWVGMSLQLGLFTNSALLIPSLSIKHAILAVIIGNGISCLVMAFTGDIGLTHGIPFAVYLRAIYGYSGTHIPSLVRGIPASFWFGFQTFLGAEAFNLILVKLTPWPGTYPYLLVIIVGFMVIQTALTARGIDVVSKFEKLVTPVLIIVVAYLLYWVLTKTGSSPAEILSVPAQHVESGNTYTFGYAITAMTGILISMAMNVPDYTRYVKTDDDANTSWFSRNWKCIWPQWIGIIPMMTIMAFIGTAGKYTSGIGDPIEYIGSMDAPLAIVIIMLFFCFFAQWTLNIGANILPPANILANVFAPKVDVAKGCIITCILALIMQGWAFADKVVTANAIVGIMLGGVIGTMLVDYYLLRGRKLNVHDLYVEGGQYSYAKNYNPAAFIAYIAGTIAGLFNFDWGFMVAGIVGGLTYFILMRFWAAKKYNQTEIIERFNIK